MKGRTLWLACCLAFILFSCKKADKKIDYQIQSENSQSAVDVEGWFQIVRDDEERSISLKITDLLVSSSNIKFVLDNAITYDLYFYSLKNNNGLQKVPGDAVLSMYSGYTFPTGQITLKNIRVDPIDETRGSVNFDVEGRVTRSHWDPRTEDDDLMFEFSVSFDNRDDPPANPGGGSGTDPCIVGTWRRSICGGGQTAEMVFRSDGTGHFKDRDCTSQCDRYIPFTYKDNGTSVTLTYKTGTLCGQPYSPTGGTQNYSCNGNTLVLGNTYQRQQ